MTLFIFVGRGDIFCSTKIEKKDLPDNILDPDENISLLMDDVKKEHIEKVLKMKKYNLTQTQKALGFGSINTLRSKIERYGIVIME